MFSLVIERSLIMSDPWTPQTLAAFAASLGLHTTTLAGGRVKFHDGDSPRALFILDLAPHDDGFCVELSFNQRDDRTQALREALLQRYDILGTDSSEAWVRLGMEDFDESCLDAIRAWGGDRVVTVVKPKPTPTGRELEPTAELRLGPWLSRFLATHGLPRPDGRPLYAYKTSDEEYIGLTHLLQLAVGFHGEQLLRKDPRFDSLFVLFAAEWWRREYRGGQWAWAPVLQAIGLDEGQVETLLDKTQSHLYPALERGFAWWRRDIFSTDAGRTFIGSLAAEGGLPLNLLNSPGTGLQQYFRHLLARYLPVRATGVSVRRIAEELRFDLPLSFRNTHSLPRLVGESLMKPRRRVKPCRRSNNSWPIRVWPI
jgi:hypothetical protein